MPYNEQQPNLVSLQKLAAEKRLPLVFWVGAGASRDAGLPTWLGLRDKLIADALETLVTISEPDASLREARLEQAAVAPSLWDAFEVIKDVMGEASYKAAVRAQFGDPDQLEIPEIYKAIWSINSVYGLLNLNIDGLANRAHRRIRPEQDELSFVGREAKNFVHLIAQRKPFIGSLHGRHQDYSSWVFTSKEIKTLLRDTAYVNVINFIFSNSRVVFLGISADDIAAGGILSQLTKQGVDTGSHYWITDRLDGATDAWANQAGLLPIRYQPDGDDHTSVLVDILHKIRDFKSYDSKAPVVIPKGTSSERIKSVQELLSLSGEELRDALSSYAKDIIRAGGDATNTDEYRKFLKEYSPAIHQAWHVTVDEPYNRFFGHDVVGKISSGPFSSVWKLRSPSGGSAALKVIQTDNLHDGPQLESFRRGVQSLSFMSQAEVPGVAKLIEAHEIPTCVLMEFIEGAVLPEIVKTSQFNFWKDGIPILVDLCTKIDIAHKLPEGVLHRDIRPSNLMLPYYFWGEEGYGGDLNRYYVYILNYDMSWHKDAKGRTISGNLQEAGYYAPEQLENSDSELARSATVDAYGVGMTLYFVASKQDPPIGGSKSSHWTESLNGIRRDRGTKWHSAVNRVRRLVLNATHIDPDLRPSVAEIGTELQLISRASNGETDDIAPDAWAEEMFCRVVADDYEVKNGGNCFEKSILKSRVVSLRGDLSKNQVHLIFRNIAADGTDWGQVKRSWAGKLRSAKEILTSGGWEIADETRYSSSEIHLMASAPVPLLRTRFDQVLDSLSRGLNAVRLE